MPAMHSAQELEALKRNQLQALCKRLGLKANGKNTELIERIIEHEQQAHAHAQQPEAAEQPSEPSIFDHAEQPPQSAASREEHEHEQANDAEPTDAAKVLKTVAASSKPGDLMPPTDPVVVEPAPTVAAQEAAADVMEVDPQTVQLQLESLPEMTLDTTASKAEAELRNVDATGPVHGDATAGAVSGETIDHYEQNDMADVYAALATDHAPQPETAAAMVADDPPELEALARADLSDVYDLASPPRPQPTSTPPPLPTITRTPPASTGLYPVIDVQRSLDTKLTFKWDPPAPTVHVERTPEKEDPEATDVAQLEPPGSPCVEKVSRKSADLLKQAAKEDAMDVDPPAAADDVVQGAVKKENVSGAGANQPVEVNKATNSAAAPGASKLRPASAPGLVPRVAKLSKKPDGRPASTPRLTATSTTATSARKLPVSTSTSAAAAAGTAASSTARLPSTSIPPNQRPKKRKATDEPDLDDPLMDPTDSHVAKRLKALAPSVAAAASSISRSTSTPGSATKVGGGAVKKSPGKPVFDLQASLKRKLNYVPKKGPLDKPAASGAAAARSSGHVAASGLGKKVI